MSMYVDLLSEALDAWPNDSADIDLLEYTVRCRSEMLRAGPPHGGTAWELLVLEVAYDRALIKLSAAHGLFAVPTNFTFPTQERARLEAELATAGMNLASFSRRRS